METSDWLSYGAVLIAVVGTMVANRNAKSAQESADAAKAQAQTAEQQLRVMQEQWDAEKAAIALAARPRLRLSVHEVFTPTNFKYGSYLEAQNQGQQPINIDLMTLEGARVNFLQFQWAQVSLPKLATLGPSERTMLMFGIDIQVGFSGTTLNRFSGWKILEIHFNHGADAKKWIYACELSYADTGQLETRAEALREG